MKRLAIMLLLAMLAAVLPLAAVTLGKDYTEIKVVVIDADKGVPVPKAAITLHFIRGKNLFRKKDRAEWDVKTDSKGQVVVPFIPEGKLKVQVLAKGFQTYGEEYEISGEQQTIEVKLLRPQSQYSAHESPKDAVKPDKKP